VQSPYEPELVLLVGERKEKFSSNIMVIDKCWLWKAMRW
jgi:hypothetical protein